MIITLPDNYTLAAIIGTALIIALWFFVLRRRREPREKKEPEKTLAISSVEKLERIAVALESIARSLGSTGGGGDIAARAEALAKQFEASAEIGFSVGLPAATIAKMIRTNILQKGEGENEKA
jgi:LPXTG-motif cell wall-anchored protein